MTIKLTERQIAAGWVAHEAGPCPVPLDSKPEVMWGDGHVTEADWIMAGEWCEHHDSWLHEGPPKHHIIAYKPEPTQ